MMKILITGSNGMVGRNIVEFLLEKNFELLTPKREELDLLNKNLIDKYLLKNKPELIIHCAGKVGGIQANINNPVSFLIENTQLAINIISSAHSTGIKKLINMSSSCMYPRNANNPLSEDLILKGELEPTNEAYALAKITGTKLCEYINKEDSTCYYKTVIPCNLYGKYDKFHPKNSHMLPAIIKKIYEAKQNKVNTVEIWGDGEAFREFMYVEDLASFIFHAINNFTNMPQNINVGLGKDYSIKRYYEEVAKVIGYKGKFLFDLSKPVGMKKKLIDNTKLKKFGWQHKTSLRLGIAKTYSYYLEEVINA